MNSILPTSFIEFDLIQHTFESISFDDFLNKNHVENKIYWIHINLRQLPAKSAELKKLRLPKIVLQLCAEKDTLPKLIEVQDALVLKMECLLNNELGKKEVEVQFSNLIICLTERYCFTASLDSIPALLNFNEHFLKSVKYAQTPCFILFLILDNAINDFSKLLIEFEYRADLIDLQIRDTHKNIFNEVMIIKKQVMKIQHHLTAIRDVLMRISGRKIPVISEPCRASLINLLDHCRIIFNEAEAIRDILKNTLDQIDNALMQKMNNTMKVLTAFAAIFLPLTLIAGIYGMNFAWIPELHWKYGYFWALFLMGLVALILFIFFKKKDWF